MNAKDLKIGDIVQMIQPEYGKDHIRLACINELRQPWPEVSPGHWVVETIFCGTSWSQDHLSDVQGEVHLKVCYRRPDGEFQVGDLVQISDSIGLIVYLDESETPPRYMVAIPRIPSRYYEESDLVLLYRHI